MEVHKEAIYFVWLETMTTICPLPGNPNVLEETLAMVDLAEACIFFRKFLLEILLLKDNSDNIKIFCKTDSSYLYDLVHSSTQILDKRLHIEMAILREMIKRKEIAEITWILTDVKIANSLTKKGVPSFKILGFISEPKESSV